MNKKERKKLILKGLIIGVLVGILYGAVIGIGIGSVKINQEELKTEACMELFLFQLNMTVYSAERLNITTEKLINDYTRYKVEEILDANEVTDE